MQALRYRAHSSVAARVARRIGWLVLAGACVACAPSLPAAPAGVPGVEAAFSPDGDAEALVLKTIGSARQSIRLAAYSFTSPTIVRALVEAKRRGVDVRIVVDDRGNRGQASRAALNLVVNAGIPTRAVGRYAIHHDKYMVVDGMLVQTGSFNYSRAAATSNSENAVVLRDSGAARQFAEHWADRWGKGRDVASEY